MQTKRDVVLRFLGLVVGLAIGAALTFGSQIAHAAGWTPMPGAATDVGDGWAIGVDPVGGDYGVWRWTGGNWQRMPGHAVRIGGSSNQPLVVNSLGQIFRWNGANWDLLPGAATDVGDGWVIGTNRIGGDYGIWRWTNGSWQAMPGLAVRIGGTYNQPMVVNSQGQIFLWNGGGWDLLPGAATDVGNGWVIGTNRIGGDFGVWRWANGSWQAMPGLAVGIGGSANQPLVVNSLGQIFSWTP